MNAQADKFLSWTRHGCAHVLRWLEHEWASVLFVVSLVSVLHHIGPLAPVSHLSLLIFSHFDATIDAAPTGASADARIWLVGITPPDFEGRYGERKPLSRCELAHDLGLILAAKPDVLAVDLDLSPISRVFDEEKPCQDRLDGLLDHSPTKIVLIDPFPAASNELLRLKQRWLADRVEGGVKFANADVETPLSLAIQHTCDPRGFAELAHESAHGDSPCAHGHHGPQPISYRALNGLVHEAEATALPAELRDRSLTGKTVFFGNRSGNADLFVTPIGSTHGVVVHAANHATFGHPLSNAKGWGYAIDLVFAAMFSGFVTWFIHRYLHAAQADDAFARARLGVLMMVFVVAYCGVVALALGVALVLLVYRAWVIEPLLIAIGLAFDAFVVAGWSHVGYRPHLDVGHCPGPQEMLRGVRRHLRQWDAGLTDVRDRSRMVAGLLILRWVAFWAVVLVALYYVFE